MYAEFLSTPSARRATRRRRPDGKPAGISIHALREEGDRFFLLMLLTSFQFLSTPSARRATLRQRAEHLPLRISIHALREEGDSKNRDKISIFL